METNLNVRMYSSTQPLSVEIGPTHVYERSNFREKAEPAVNATLWIYDEICYTLGEYTQRQQDKINQLESISDNMLLDFELRLIELEARGGVVE